MSSSSWPPQLKAWVQECLAQATTANKPAVNAELKQILFQAHRDGTVNTTDWSKVELQSLKKQATRVAPHIPVVQPIVAQPYMSPAYPAPVYTSPVYAAPSYTPPPPSSSAADFVSFHSSPQQPQHTNKKKDKQKEKQKKRKNNDNFPSAYTFETPEEAAAKARRAARFQNSTPPVNGGNGPVATGLDPIFPESGLQSRISGLIPGQVGRKKLKGKGGLGYGGAEVMEVDPNVIDWDAHTIRGTSTRLEKSYLRLTSEPDPADIRPLPVLKQTLALLKSKWKENHNYAYAVDQFKSMRQDLTVQRIKNEFTVEVYEIHARIALEAKDLGEYNQCQSMLRQLYELGLKGHPEEFLSYRIMYLLHTRNRADLGSLLGQLTEKEKEDPGVAHALAVAAALATSNYVRFFRLFLTAPNMSGYIMDHFVERERAQALAVMSKAYMTLPLPYLTRTLAFEVDDETDEFLAGHSANLYTNPTLPIPPRDPSNPWKPIPPPKATPLAERVWDCRKAHFACAKAVEKYRVVDLKGQVD